jgi:hypothetical protein
VIRWSFTYIHVSRSPHCAVNNLTGDTGGRASPEARTPPPCTVWLSARLPSLTARCGGPTPNRECGLPVGRTFPCVPDRAGVSCWEPRRPARCGWAPRDRGPHNGRDAVAPVCPGGLTQSRAAGVRWGPHPLELCAPRGATRRCGLGGHRTPLAPRPRLGLEPGPAGGPRGPAAPGRTGGPHAVACCTLGSPCKDGLGGYPGEAPAAPGGGGVAAPRPPGRGDDARQERARRPGWSAASRPWQAVGLPRPSEAPGLVAGAFDAVGQHVPGSSAEA